MTIRLTRDLSNSAADSDLHRPSRSFCLQSFLLWTATCYTSGIYQNAVRLEAQLPDHYWESLQLLAVFLLHVTDTDKIDITNCVLQ